MLFLPAGAKKEVTKPLKVRYQRCLIKQIDTNNGLSLRTEIASQTNYRAEVQLLDLSSFDSVTAFAKRLEGDPIDIVVANAAVAMPEYTPTKDGWESTYVVHKLSSCLLY